MSDNGPEAAKPVREPEKRYQCGCLVHEKADLWLVETPELLLMQCNNCKRIWNVKLKAKQPESRIIRPS